jgi:hypothetical protein
MVLSGEHTMDGSIFATLAGRAGRASRRMDVLSDAEAAVLGLLQRQARDARRRAS